MPYKNRVLVIDDKPEDGEAIVRRLWQKQIASYFFSYNQDSLLDLDENKKFNGVRVIFQDIQLVSVGHPDNADYSAAATAIDKLIENNNGPWLMVAWSTWGDDPEKGDLYARNLFELLKERLEPGKQPHKFVVIDKSPFTADRLHGEVRNESNISSNENEQLLELIDAAIETPSALNSLTQWESDIRTSSSSVINDLWRMANHENPESSERTLGGILFKLAQAQEGRVSRNNDISHPLYQLLSLVLYDKSINMDRQNIIIGENIDTHIDASQLNTILHWDSSQATHSHPPGSVYQIEWPHIHSVQLGTITLDNGTYKSFIKQSFIVSRDKQDTFEKDDTFLENTSLVILDITPACDHANNKAIWRRFIVGVKAHSTSRHHFYQGKNSKEKLPSDFLRGTPVFFEQNEKFNFIFNSKLIFSLEDSSDTLGKLKYTGRLREQLLLDLLSWYGSMATRPGIVSID